LGISKFEDIIKRIVNASNIIENDSDIVSDIVGDLKI
jgi:peptidoglycan hydrolase CwlO-like protein